MTRSSSSTGRESTTTTTTTTHTTNNSMHPASSRLNLINQLVGLGANPAPSRYSKKSNNGLNDFQNVSFANYFFMAGHRFKNIITQAQTFLFGDQLDLGFLLAHKPISVFNSSILAAINQINLDFFKSFLSRSPQLTCQAIIYKV